jgi:hypothetical protein
MEQRCDHASWFDQSQRAKQDSGETRPLDWHSLAAQLCAGHAYQRAMAQGEAAWPPPGGSFDPIAAQQLIDYALSASPDWGFESALKGALYPDINPVVLGVRKNMSGTDTGVVSRSTPAIEG